MKRGGLTRVQCRACGKKVALHSNGTLWAHSSEWLSICPNSGRLQETR